MRYWRALAIIVALLSIAYVIFENDLLFILAAAASVPLFRAKRTVGTALFGLALLSSCILYYFAHVEYAFGLAIASMGILCGGALAALAFFGGEGRMGAEQGERALKGGGRKWRKGQGS